MADARIAPDGRGSQIRVEPVGRRPELLDRLSAMRAGRYLLTLGEGVYLVGGAVRDLLLEREPRELDVVVEGDAGSVAELLAERIGEGARAVVHERFRTATIEQGGAGALMDIAGARSETYAQPGALPTVTPASLAEDLPRRDFTVNAIALALGGERAGEVTAPAGALEDLRAGVLRVLHEGSFLDDPTRLLRLARYAARLGFEPERRTGTLAGEAIRGGALETVSSGRIGAELRLGLREREPLDSIEAMSDLGILRGIHPRLRFERTLVERSLKILGGADDVRPDLLVLASLMIPITLRMNEPQRGREARSLLDRLEFPAADRDRAVGSALAVIDVGEELYRLERPSELREALAGVPPEGVALAAGLAAQPSQPRVSPEQSGQRADAITDATLWISRWRHQRLRIDGRDLIAAGVPEGPEVGRRLEAALGQLLDGLIADDPEAQLQAALEAKVG